MNHAAKKANKKSRNDVLLLKSGCESKGIRPCSHPEPNLSALPGNGAPATHKIPISFGLFIGNTLAIYASRSSWPSYQPLFFNKAAALSANAVYSCFDAMQRPVYIFQLFGSAPEHPIFFVGGSSLSDGSEVLIPHLFRRSLTSPVDSASSSIAIFLFLSRILLNFASLTFDSPLTATVSAFDMKTSKKFI